MHFHLSFRVNERKPEVKMRLTKVQTDILAEHQKEDEALYSHFRAKLESQILLFGVSRMKEEVTKLRWNI